METQKTDKNKEVLCAHFYDDIEYLKNFSVTLEPVQGDPLFEGSEPPWVFITKPGCYVLEYDQTVIPTITRLKQVWGHLTRDERKAFLAGLEAADMPAAERCPEGDIPF
jgi:hypothetical protein